MKRWEPNGYAKRVLDWLGRQKGEWYSLRDIMNGLAYEGVNISSTPSTPVKRLVDNGYLEKTGETKNQTKYRLLQSGVD